MFNYAWNSEVAMRSFWEDAAKGWKQKPGFWGSCKGGYERDGWWGWWKKEVRMDEN